MERVNEFDQEYRGGASGVILDVCRSHGLWFDANELSQLLAWVRCGGLTAARREVGRLKGTIKHVDRDQAKLAIAADTAARMQSARMRSAGFPRSEPSSPIDVFAAMIAAAVGALADLFNPD